MTITVKNMGISKFKSWNASQFIISFKPSYQYKVKVLDYDEFDFIVDSGSLIAGCGICEKLFTQ